MSGQLKLIASLKALRGSVAIFFGANIFIPSKNSEWFLQVDFVPEELKSLPFFTALANWASNLSPQQMVAISMFALALGALRWIEAIGI